MEYFEQLNTNGCVSYFLASPSARKAWLVDPLLVDTDRYLALLKQHGCALEGVIDTHTHADHLSAGAWLVNETKCFYLMHESSGVKCVTDRVSDALEIDLHDVKVHLMHTPGHTRDSMCVILPDRILTGDCLFLDDGGAGRDDLPGGDPSAHFESLQRLRQLPDDLTVYPGHDYRRRSPSTLAVQKDRNPFFKPGTSEEYVNFIQELKLGPADWMKLVLKANSDCVTDASAVYVPTGMSSCEVMGTMSTCASSQEVQHVSPSELSTQLAMAHKYGCESPILLDVRESAELTGELGHLPHIIHIPVGTLESRLTELDYAKNREIVTICKIGGRAKTAAKLLLSAGYANVKVMTGGMTGWNEVGLPIEREPLIHA